MQFQHNTSIFIPYILFVGIAIIKVNFNWPGIIFMHDNDSVPFADMYALITYMTAHSHSSGVLQVWVETFLSKSQE
jgi:hypothetical protein